MQIVLPDSDWASDPRWTAGLDVVARWVYGNPRYMFFERCDFIPTAKFKRSSRPDLIEFRHVYTRGCLVLDAQGIGYRYLVPASYPEGRGQFRRHKSIVDALDAVCLWFVPWKKPGFERYQFGNTWEQRWAMHPSQVQLALSPKEAEEHWYSDAYEADYSMFREPPPDELPTDDGPQLRLLS